jgi:hypothetical protein
VRRHQSGRPPRSTCLPAGLLALIVFAGLPAAAVAQPTAQEQRVAASFVLALGRGPTADEAARWASRGPSSVAELIALHRQDVQKDAAAARAVAAKADDDAFGGASLADRPAGRPAAGIYSDLVRQHVQYLADHAADYQQVLNRAYRLVVQRDAYPMELDYWKRLPALPFSLLVACVENWAARNQPGLTATSGVPAASVTSRYLVTVTLSPAVAGEARAALGLEPAGDRAMATAAGRHVVSPGASEVVSVGGIHFAAAGAAGLSLF